MVEEFRQRGIPPRPIITLDIQAEWVTTKWRGSEYATTYTAKRIGYGWVLSYKGQIVEKAVTTDDRLMCVDSHSGVYRDGEEHYTYKYTANRGMSTRQERRATIHRGFGRVSQDFIAIHVEGGYAIPADHSILVDCYGDDHGEGATRVYRTLHEVLVDTLALLMSCHPVVQRDHTRLV